jgi:hypothetical protein
MGLKLTRRAPGWEGSIVAGNTLTLRLPIGLTYNQVYTEYNFTDAGSAVVPLATAVGEIRVVANGRPIWSIQASELDIINQYEGRSAAQGILTIDFDRYNLRTRAAEEFTSIGTGTKDDPTPLTTLTIEMDLKAGGGVTAGTLASKLRQSDSRVLGLFKKRRRYIHVFTGAATVEIADYPKGDLINAAHFFESANDIDSIRLERDNFVMFDRSKELNSRIQIDGVRVPQVDLYVYDTCEDGNGTDQLVTQGVNDLRWFIEIDGAMTITTIMDYIGALEK